MLYTINGFTFDSISLVLSENGTAVEIRHNEAKLLALLLGNSDKVLTKEEILAQVWQGKVVSEQAVFQNISNLRSVFGNAAIKTFPKRGYQWQLEYNTVNPNSVHTSTVDSNSGKPTEAILDKQLPITPQASNRNLLFAIAAVLLVCLAVVTVSFNDKANTDIGLSYIPIKDEQGNEIALFNSDDAFDVTELKEFDHWHFMAAIEEKYRTLKNEHPIVLTGKVREFENQLFLDFLLKGPADQWSGVITAPTKQELNAKLKRHLSQDFIYQLITEPHSFQLQQAALSLAHQQTANDFVVLGRLIDVYKSMDETERAIVLAEKLEEQARAQGNALQLGVAYLAQGNLLYIKKLYDLSEQKLSLAEQEFASVADLTRQADIWDVRSQIALAQKDYERVRDSLLQSAKLAESAKDVERELHALTYLSVLAHKFSKDEDRYIYLTQAEQKMNEYNLPQYRFAKIPFHHAIYTESKAAKEPHLKQVLIYTELTPDHWVAQSSREQLVEFYIEQNRVAEAIAIVDQLNWDNADNSYLKALVASAQQDENGFVQHARKAFEQAQLSGDTSLSLNVALMLCERSRDNVNVDYYAHYITENATERWRRGNEQRLLSLNL